MSLTFPPRSRGSVLWLTACSAGVGAAQTPAHWRDQSHLLPRVPSDGWARLVCMQGSTYLCSQAGARTHTGGTDATAFPLCPLAQPQGARAQRGGQRSPAG